MKKKQAALVLGLLFLSGLGMVCGSLSCGRVQPQGQSFVISEYGTLLEVFDANGKSRFGKLAADGFQISYQAHGNNASVSAIGAKGAQGLVGGQPHYDRQSATVTVTTVDKALEITSNFVLNEEAKTLTIVRRLRNISADTINLQIMSEYVDQKLVAEGQPLVKQPSMVQLALGRIRAGQGPDIDCTTRFCVPPPPPPPCENPPCPNVNKYVAAQLITEATGRGDQITLRWKDGTTLGSQGPGSPSFVVQMDIGTEPKPGP